jgi:(2Fe-2S) ferredoxin/predicted O-methyltransferase YrrM
MEPFRIHLFVCAQQKPDGIPSCPASGSFAVLDALDHEIQARGLCGDVQLTTCGCMGLCEEGPVMVVYPEGIWYRRVQPSDLSEIVGQHLCDGKPVDRLIWNDASVMKAMSIEHGEDVRHAMATREKAGMLPDRLNEMIRGFMPSRCILTALELDIFTAIGDGANAEQVGTRIHANSRAVGILLNALAALGLLSKTDNDYRNTTESARFFVQGSKDNHRNGLLHTVNIWHRWSTLTEAVRRGTRIPIAGADNPEWTANFIAGMQRNAKDRAPLVVKALGTAGVRRILDLGGGSGAYSIAFAKASPDAHCEILDLPQVVPLTSEYVSMAGVSAQVSIRSGDMLHDPFGSGYDIILLNAICHMFSEEQNQDIFRRARQALAPNGRLVVQDFILNPDKAGPQHAALFSVNMLVGTDAGATYSEAEYAGWMKAAGITEISRIKLSGPSDLIVGLVK